MLEQLLSKEVNDVSVQQLQSVEELRKALEDKERENQALRKENAEKDRRNEEQTRRIKELEALLASKQ